MSHYLRAVPAVGLLLLPGLLADNDRDLKQAERPADAPGERLMQSKRASNRIDYIEIPATDVQAAKKFYGSVFGWSFVDYGPDYASFNDGRLDGGLRQDKGGGRGGPLVIFYDDDLEGKTTAIKEAGGQIVQEIFEFPGGRRFHFLDPDGNEFAIWSE